MKLKYWLPTIFWMAIIFTLSSFPTVKTTTVGWQDFMLKKMAHFVEYFILATLLQFSLTKTSSLSHGKMLLTSFILAVIYATSDEYHQSLVPGREPRVRDIVIDSLGALTSVFLALTRQKFQRTLPTRH